MRPAWVRHYLHLPFVEKGRTREGLDCYGLVRLVLREQRGIELPSYTESYTTTTDAEEIGALLRGERGSRWQDVPLAEARMFDGLLLRIAGQPIHFGLVLEPPEFLHVMRASWVTVERWESLSWVTRVVGAVRCQP